MTNYIIAIVVDHKPKFNWLVLHILKRRNAMIALFKNYSARYLKYTHELRIEYLKTVENALTLVKQNSNKQHGRKVLLRRRIPKCHLMYQKMILHSQLGIIMLNVI